VLEPNVSVQEETIEILLKRFEEGLRNLVLDRRWQFCVKIELFDNQIEIVHKSILNELFDGVVKFVGDFFFLVAILEPQ
jgi:hypothetical protein